MTKATPNHAVQRTAKAMPLRNFLQDPSFCRLVERQDNPWLPLAATLHIEERTEA
jgi:hypothetical protein